MIQKEDANTIATKTREAYIDRKLVDLISICIREIRQGARDMRFNTTIILKEKNYRFLNEILTELIRIIKSSGYEISISKTPHLSNPTTRILIIWE